MEFPDGHIMLALLTDAKCIIYYLVSSPIYHLSPVDCK